MKLLAKLAAGAAVVCSLGTALVSQQALIYPPARQVAQTDVYHGRKVRDPYRWLEDLDAPETQAWVQAQNAFTDTQLETVPFRRALARRVRDLVLSARVMGPRGGSAVQVGEATFFRRQSPGDAQPKVYVQERIAAPRLLLDPNTWSADGATELGQFAPSPDGRFVVYGKRQGGSDWQDYRVLDVASGRDLEESLTGIIGAYTAWVGTEGFYYARPRPTSAPAGTAAARSHHSVYFHQLNTPQSDDRLIHWEPERPHQHFNVRVSSDERWLVLLSSAPEGGGTYTGVRVRPLSAEGDWVTVVGTAPSGVDVVDVTGDAMLLVTREAAPRGRVVRVDLRRPAPTHWTTLIPEQDDVMEGVSTGGRRIFVRLLQDVTSRMLAFREDGTLERELTLPGPGLAFGFSGQPQHRSLFYTFTSLAVPDTIYRYDVVSGRSEVFARPEIPDYAPESVETRQVFYPGKDGTRIPMFLLHRKGLRLDGRNPALLHGYGAFGARTWPWFDAGRMALIEQGFVFAIANIRGGGEYGQAWHEAGRRRNRQTTFDDFIAAAEWLVAEQYTSPSRLAMHGRSSGGTLVAAVMQQRPELFGAVVAEAGVMDMFRFQRFTGGVHWVAENGSSDDAADFDVLARFSPLHTVRPGQSYPAVLVTAADHDDRVVPSHSYKYVATLQAKADPSRPALLRVATRSGHADSSAVKTAERLADIYAFLFKYLNVQFDETATGRPQQVASFEGAGRRIGGRTER